MVYLAARMLGCTPQTIYNRAKRTQSIQDAIDNSRGELVDLAEQKFRAAIMNGEPWAVAMALKTIGKGRGYVERQEVTGNLNLNLRQLTDDQLEQIANGADPAKFVADKGGG